jgi:4-amino-4-deoxy-L-arabinose transferase-like glycosyltransferase
MPRNIFSAPRALWVGVPLALFLYFFRLDAVGILGPDEPRYAAIAREMARSGDWITPTLWGSPWFEKPALLYWMSGAAFKLGFGPDLAPRVPVATMTIAFLGFYWWILNREFGCSPATIATLILGTCAAILFFSQAGVTDLPVTATFSAAILLALPWIARRETRYLPIAAAMLGLAVMAKSLPPLALSAPLVIRWRWWRDLVRWRVILPFLAIALPWHVLCYLPNGRPFIETLFIEHQFGRFTSGALQHVQKWWFYGPVLLGLLLPWTPLLGLLLRRGQYRDTRRLFLLAIFLFGLVLFSASVNKLPGYLLPLFPSLVALIALALVEARSAAPWLAACALLLVAFPIAAPILPEAVAVGLSRAPRPAFHWTWILPLIAAAAAWALESAQRRIAATGVIALGAALGLIYLKVAAAPEVDRLASARTLWRSIAPHANEACIDKVNRTWQYGLNYYSVTPLPECSEDPRPLHVVQPIP